MLLIFLAIFHRENDVADGISGLIEVKLYEKEVAIRLTGPGQTTYSIYLHKKLRLHF